jgi:peptide deformylase
MKLLRRKQFGDPILRKQARRLTVQEIASSEIQGLIAEMKNMLEKRSYGVGLAAPQVGRSVAVSVIGIKPTPSRPKNPKIELVIINPEVVKTHGRRVPMWEGCISFGIGPSSPYAKALRYKKVRVQYLDQDGIKHEEDFEGILGHVVQHEIDHLNGVLFVDHVRDSKTYMTISEYQKQYVKKRAPKRPTKKVA